MLDVLGVVGDRAVRVTVALGAHVRLDQRLHLGRCHDDLPEFAPSRGLEVLDIDPGQSRRTMRTTFVR